MSVSRLQRKGAACISRRIASAARLRWDRAHARHGSDWLLQSGGIPEDSSMRTPLLRSVLAVALVWGLAACAARPPASDPEALQEYRENNDPYEPANRVGYAISNGRGHLRAGAGRAGLRVRGARAVRPPVHNVLRNMTSPVAVHQRRGADPSAPTPGTRSSVSWSTPPPASAACSTSPHRSATRTTTTISARPWRCGACRRGRSCSCRCWARPTRGTRPASAWTCCSTR